MLSNHPCVMGVYRSQSHLSESFGKPRHRVSRVFGPLSAYAQEGAMLGGRMCP